MATGGLSAPAPLGAGDLVDDFDCGEPALDDWLRHRARANEGRFSRTYVVCRERRVVAYASILAGTIERIEAPARLRRNAPAIIPVSIIGRLAVDRREAGQGLGADLLGDALRRIGLASRSIGIGAVLVHAKSDAARRFYMKCAEFLEYPADSRTLFLPLETIIAALD